MPDRAFDGRGAARLGAAQGGDRRAVADALVKAGASVRSTALVGSHATRYRCRERLAAAGVATGLAQASRPREVVHIPAPASRE